MAAKFTNKIDLISLNPGEISKSLKSYFFICDEILKLNVDRKIKQGFTMLNLY